MRRMLVATVLLIVVIAVFGISYAVISLPLEYTTEALQDSYEDIATDMGWDDAEETNSNIGMNPYYLAAAVVFGVVLFFIWYFAYAQKNENERYYR